MDIQSILGEIEGRYNAEHDWLPGGPQVMWVDERLCAALGLLLERVEELEKKVKALQVSTDE